MTLPAEPSIQNPPPDPERLMAELRFLNELSLVVARETELQPILDWIVQKTTAMFRADEGTIKLLAPETAQPTAITVVAQRNPGISSGSWPAAVSMNVMGFLMAKNEPLLTPDLAGDPRFPNLKDVDTRVRAALAVPLRVGNRITGLLAVTQSAPGRQWSADDLQLLSIVASNSAGVLENARLREQERERARLAEEARRTERELNLARDIQMSLVPSRPLRVGGWEAVGRLVPARQVGGDAFDYYAVGPDRFAAAIADVSGKGVPAALMSTNVQASLRAFCDGRSGIRDAMRHLNASVARSASSGKFITLFYLEVDVARGRIAYSNAGHNYPLLRRRDGTLIELREGGLPLGILESSEYETGEQTLEPGDAILLFSDGISEAVGPRDAEYGDERLRATWVAQRGAAADAAIEAILADVVAFRGRTAQSDDMTLVVVSEHTGA